MMYFRFLKAAKAIICKKVHFFRTFFLATVKITLRPGEKHEYCSQNILFTKIYAEYLEFKYITKTNQLSL